MVYTYIILIGKPLGRFKLGYNEIRCEIVDWIYLAQDKIQCRAFEITVMSLRISYKVKKFLN
jgi:hypothetical protein